MCQAAPGTGQTLLSQNYSAVLSTCYETTPCLLPTAFSIFKPFLKKMAEKRRREQVSSEILVCTEQWRLELCGSGHTYCCKHLLWQGRDDVVLQHQWELWLERRTREPSPWEGKAGSHAGARRCPWCLLLSSEASRDQEENQEVSAAEMAQWVVLLPPPPRV